MTRYMWEITIQIRQSHGSWAPLFIADICRQLAWEIKDFGKAMMYQRLWSNSEHICLLAISELGDMFSIDYND